jgi:hypothetical protein
VRALEALAMAARIDPTVQSRVLKRKKKTKKKKKKKRRERRKKRRGDGLSSVESNTVAVRLSKNLSHLRSRTLAGLSQC